MATTFKLDDIRTAAEAKYGNTKIEVGEHVVTLKNVLQLPKEKRDAVAGMSSDLDAEGVDQVAVLGSALRIVADTDEQADILLSAVGDRLDILLEIFNSYTGGTQVGEA